MIVRTSEQILQGALDRLVRETPVSMTSPGSVARTLFEIMSEEMSYDYRLMDTNLNQLFLSSAGGASLEAFGQMFNITRTNTPSAIDANSGRLYFYLNSKDNHEPGLSDMDNTTGQSIVIPTGTVLSTKEVGARSNPITWTTTAPCTIPVGKHMCYASVAPTVSTDNTVGAGMMCYTSLLTADFPNVYVYNREDLQAKPNIESDTNLRYRIVNAINLSAKGNTLALRLAALAITGVRDCKVIPLAYGIGTIKVVVILEDPSAPTSSAAFASAAQAIQDASSAGDIVTITRPLETTIGLTAFLVGTGLTASTKKTATLSIIRYLSSLGVGEPIIPARIINEAMSISPEVTDFVILDGGFRISDVPSVFVRTSAREDEQFYPNVADIIIL